MEIILPFSYWIFLWFVLYEYGIITYNPFWWLCIAFLLNIVQFSTMVYYQNDGLYLFLFLFINFFIKIVPIYILSDSFYKKIVFTKDILPGIICLSIYTLWFFLVISRGSYATVVKYIKKNRDAIRLNKPNTSSPFVYYISKAIRKYV